MAHIFTIIERHERLGSIRFNGQSSVHKVLWTYYQTLFNSFYQIPSGYSIDKGLYSNFFRNETLELPHESEKTYCNNFEIISSFEIDSGKLLFIGFEFLEKIKAFCNFSWVCLMKIVSSRLGMFHSNKNIV